MSFQSAIAKLQHLQKVPLKQVCKALAEEGKVEVDGAYSTASSTGNGSWSTRVKDLENGASLVAEGEDVGFLEFGTGIQTTQDEFASVVDFPVYPGSWSETHEKQFTSKGYWRFMYGDVLSERITGTPATRGMQKALDRIRESKTAVEEIRGWIKGK